MFLDRIRYLTSTYRFSRYLKLFTSRLRFRFLISVPPTLFFLFFHDELRRRWRYRHCETSWRWKTRKAQKERKISPSLCFPWTRHKALIKLHSYRESKKVRRKRLSLKLVGRSWPSFCEKMTQFVWCPHGPISSEKRKWKRWGKML